MSDVLTWDGPSTTDPTGTVVGSLADVDVGELERLVVRSGLDDVSLSARFSVVFAYPGMGVGDVYPELAGCTTQVCAFIEEAGVFAKHGVQVVGLSTEISDAPEGCIAIPFPVGQLPQDAVGGLIPAVDKGERRYAVRTTYLIWPDGTGVAIGAISDVVGHARRCLRLVEGRRLAAYRDEAVAAMRRKSSIRWSASSAGLLANGADSVAISRVNMTMELVAKLADPAIIDAEASHVERVNELLAQAGRGQLFPTVVAIRTDEVPAWYLMEAANPLPLDHLLFSDEARTQMDPSKEWLLAGALAKLAALYEITLEERVAPVARYHYLERFVGLPARDDFRGTFALLFGSGTDLPGLLQTEVVVDGAFHCRSYADQVRFLESVVDELCQPVSAKLHGDAHLPNMLVSAEGDEVVFIDPRTVWDGHDVGEPGVGDPLYDYGTLLHSLHVVSPVLRAIDAGDTESLLGVALGPPTIEVSHRLLTLPGNEVAEAFVGWVERSVPAGVRGRHWRARLHVNAANALLGWLKYARALRTRQAWMAIFVSALYHLEVARRDLESDPNWRLP